MSDDFVTAAADVIVIAVVVAALAYAASVRGVTTVVGTTVLLL